MANRLRRETYLRSTRKRGRWFHYYRRGGKEISLGVHGLHPTDPAVFTAYCAAHARWEHSPPDTQAPASNTFAWGVDLYLQSEHWKGLAEGTKVSRLNTFTRYKAAQGKRPLDTITRADLEAALHAKGGHAARNELKALRPVFAYLERLRVIARSPARGIELDKVKTKGFATATPAEIERFIEAHPRGTTARLIFDLALFTGAARVDLVKLSRRNIRGDVLTYTRQKTGVAAEVPMTPELVAAIDHLPEIAPAFILRQCGKPRTANGVGTAFRDACIAAGVEFRLHGLRKAFCTYWAEKGATTHQIAAMAGHKTLSEVEIYTREVDRRRIVQMLVERK